MDALSAITKAKNALGIEMSAERIARFDVALSTGGRIPIERSIRCRYGFARGN
jgi:hypothetical protein